MSIQRALIVPVLFDKFNSMGGETFGQRLKRLRLARGLSQRKLAAEVGLNNGTISLAESEALWVGQLPSYDIMLRLAASLRVSIEVLAGEKQEEKPELRRYSLAEILENIGAVPVPDDTLTLDMLVSAGSGKRAHIPQGIEGVETVPYANGRQLYALRVTGDCMDPEIKPGEVVCFDPERPPEDGDLVVATQHGEKALVKWLDQRSATIQYLMSLNADPILIDESIQVIGVVADVRRRPPRRTTRHKKAKPVSPRQRALLPEEPQADD